ncbi:hypothetical protein QJS04_geneDACA017122 [Acorus gramineus]|uniref:Uncharacterized protein n=1 Tax=Acorus gramineus TaxID=55184 RepID=A0AAV9AY14_ACOGR|nr:hypothetical protein QJS04_geneDACA017122 [Acorus gramineus]
MGKKKPKSRRKKPPRHTIFEGEFKNVCRAGDESPSNAQNDSLEEQNGLCLTQSRHDSSESEGNSEEEQEMDSINSDSYVYENLLKMAEVLLEGKLYTTTEPIREVNILVDDESTDDVCISINQVLDLTRALSEKNRAGEAALLEHKKEIRRLKNINKQDSKALKLIRDSKESLDNRNLELESRLWILEEEKEKLIAEAKVVSDLREKNQALQQESVSATQRIQNLTNELQTMSKLREDQEDARKWENIECKNEKDKLNQRLRGLEKQKEELECVKVETNLKIEQLSIDNQQMKEEISRLERSLEVENEKLIAEAKVVSDLREKNQALQKESDSAAQPGKNLTNGLQTMTKLKEENSRKCENVECMNEKDKLNQRLRDLEKQKKELECEKVEAKSKIEQLIIDNQQMKEDISRLKWSLEEEKEKLIAEAKVVSGLQEEIQALQPNFDSATRQIRNLTNKLGTMLKLKRDQEDSKKHENVEHNNEKEKLNQRLWGLEKQKEELELEKVEAMSKIEQLSIDNQQMKEEISRLEQSHQASNIEETEGLLNKLAVTILVDEEISEKLKKAEEELDDLKRDMKLKGEEIDKLRCEKVAALSNEIQQITKELQVTNEGLKQVVQSKDAKIEELKVKAQEYLNNERLRMSHVVGMLEGKVFTLMNNMSSIHNQWSACLAELQGTRQNFATPRAIYFEPLN